MISKAADKPFNNINNIQPSYVLTFLSKDYVPQKLEAAISLLKRHDLDVQQVKLLSANPSAQEHIPAVLEISASGSIPDLQKLRNELFQLSNQQETDLVFQPDDLFRRHRRIAVFDMDSTLIQAEVIDLLAEVQGIGDQVSQITERAMRGELDFNQSFTKRLAMLKGLDESVLANIAESLPITPGAERLINTLKLLGYHTVIISGGFVYFARYLQDKLGIDEIHANELGIVEGKVTGVVSGTIINGERKAELLKTIAQREGIPLEQVIAVGDGANDLPMIGQAGLGVAFEAKPLVRQKAEHAISHWELDGVLYLLGISDAQLQSVK